MPTPHWVNRVEGGARADSYMDVDTQAERRYILVTKSGVQAGKYWCGQNLSCSLVWQGPHISSLIPYLPRPLPLWKPLPLPPQASSFFFVSSLGLEGMDSYSLSPSQELLPRATRSLGPHLPFCLPLSVLHPLPTHDSNVTFCASCSRLHLGLSVRPPRSPEH